MFEDALTVGAGLAMIPLVAATVFFCLQCALGLPEPVAKAPPARRSDPLAVLIPAHNEEETITATLDSLRQQLTQADRLLVVADNCNDRTAQRARQGGAEVLVRRDPDCLGKGYALAAGIRHLAAAPPRTVIVIDADCSVAPGAIAYLAEAVEQEQRPIQARYLMLAPEQASEKFAIAAFAFLIKNSIRPQGLRSLGLPCQLTGSGMAFPWTVIASAELSHGHLVEDMKLGLDLARSGSGASYCHAALITSCFPLSSQGQASQRQRWETGRIALVRSCASWLFSSATYRRPALVLLLLDALIPPLTLLAALLCLHVVAAAALVVAGGTIWLLFAAAVSWLAFISAIATAWWRHGKELLPLPLLSSLPFWLLKRLALFPSFYRSPHTHWIRTDRSAGDF
ncbi:MAG: glycosyltransferase family 2 protein [Alphaproteobacteria bacterium]|nr:glycosyltransferase family 2 protein [Alphaproteobacteria bacterium]MBU1552194.1 glycosyltransferase family 2 protein [Alphaproteobacteria bacterium]MBU2336896.1 glycosyltransferase family 2 protein [Alphaproteobacteria bacterium]MBU2389653.1 glycosyltransferase family 2 protein [Alphaproteobacteria bacterium]